MLKRPARRPDPRHADFWSRRRRLASFEIAPESAPEDIRSRDGGRWEALWNGEVDRSVDDKWAEFVAGDATNKREVAWLLS